MGGADALHGLVEDGHQRSQILVAYNSIREDVLREIKWDPRKISASDITVAVKDKVVTLSGFCSNLLG